MTSGLPAWAEEMRDLFKSGSVAQFLIHGNLFDIVPAPGPVREKAGSVENFSGRGDVRELRNRNAL